MQSFTTGAFTGAQPETKMPSLVVDAGAVLSRIRELTFRLSKAGDYIHGPSPKEVAPSTPPEAVAPTLRRTVDLAHEAVGDLEREMSRLESRL